MDQEEGAICVLGEAGPVAATKPPSKPIAARKDAGWLKGPTTEKNREARIKLLFKELRLQDCAALKTDAQLAKATALLLKYFHVFSWDGRPGITKILEHRIRLRPGAKPVRAPCRPVNPLLESKLKAVLDTWLKEGVIVPSESEWASPLVLVTKKDGALRVCVDFRQVNEQTIRDNWDIGDVQALIARLQGSRVFSSLDQPEAFQHVRVAPEDQELTAFTSPFGTYQFNVMPYGLAGAPQTYARLIHRVLEGIPYSQALPFIDDCAVHSKDLEGHFVALENVLAAFAKANIKLKPSKCTFFSEEIKFLGHYIDHRGMRVDPKYVAVVRIGLCPTQGRGCGFSWARPLTTDGS